MELLCKYVGGSHLYGLANENSDLDERGVFINTDPLNVFGFRRLDNKVVHNEETDLVLHELTQFLHLATRSNTQTMECLFAPEEAFSECTNDFRKLVLDQRLRFLDSVQLIKSLKGYMHNELRLAIGERTGQLGSKRKQALEKYGFSYKNFSHLFRLAECGRQFFSTDHFPTDMSKSNPDVHQLCYDLKNEPGSFDKDDLVARVDKAKEQMIDAFVKRENNYTPDFNYVGSVLKHLYKRYL